jgi:hypothetical protein
VSDGFYSALRQIVRVEGLLTFGFVALILLLKSMENNSQPGNSAAPFLTYGIACLAAPAIFKNADRTGMIVLSILAALPFLLIGGATLWQRFR